ncbi:MAG: S8 family serine peptidase [Alphaproteobacteria bacterium]|nr:S8 family serine peptidase [Alphaproteobacteria bacterium]
MMTSLTKSRWLALAAVLLLASAPLALASKGSGGGGSGSGSTPGGSSDDPPEAAEPDDVGNESPDDSTSHDDDAGSDDGGSSPGGSGDDGDDDSGDSDSSGGSDDSGSGDSDSGDSSSSGHGSGHDDGDDSHSNSGSGSSGSGTSGSNHSGSGHSGSGESGSGSNSGSSANAGPGNVHDDFAGRNERGERVREGEVVLVTSVADVAKIVGNSGLRVIEDIKLTALGLRVVRVAVPGDGSAGEVMKTLHELDPSAQVTYNHLYEPARGPALPPAALNPAPRAKPAARVNDKIGLIDAGVDGTHPLLSQVTVTSRAFGARVQEIDKHGTAVASRLAEAAPGATIVAANVFTLTGDGKELASADAIARGLDWLAQLEVPVINLSLTGPANPILEAVAERLIARGHVLVAAVGNEGPRGAPQYPAAYHKVVGVTAVDGRQRVYIYANQGDYVDFAATGVDTLAANDTGKVERVSGTSYAAPIVAAALARLVSKPDPQLAQDAVNALQAQAQDVGAPGRDPVYGYGVIHLPR